MKFEIGDVMRLEYKWPHQGSKDDGNKARPCVVFQDEGGKFFTSPMSTVPPDARNAPYAIPVTSGLQRQLGVSDGKPSWVYANHANLVEPPNPAIRKASQDSWTHGRVPPGMLQSMKIKRDAAIANRDMSLASIKRDDSLERYRTAAGRRLTPGQPGNNAARAGDVQAKAAERARRLAATAKARRDDISR